MRKTLIALTEDQFIDRFKPEHDAEGTVYVQRELPKDRLAILDAQAGRRLWTMVEAEDSMYLVQGSHYVNRLYYVICEVPYEKDEEFEIEMDV
jgi:hypothetical protein